MRVDFFSRRISFTEYTCILYCYYHKYRTRLEKAAEGIEKKFDQTQKDIQILQQRIAQLSTGGGGGATAESA